MVTMMIMVLDAHQPQHNAAVLFFFFLQASLSLSQISSRGIRRIIMTEITSCVGTAEEEKNGAHRKHAQYHRMMLSL